MGCLDFCTKLYTDFSTECLDLCRVTEVHHTETHLRQTLDQMCIFLNVNS